MTESTESLPLISDALTYAVVAAHMFPDAAELRVTVWRFPRGHWGLSIKPTDRR